jgi:hypothetical protein
MSTAYATLDTANRTFEKLSALGCSVNFFADVCHVHRSTMAAHFSGKKPFRTQESERLLDVAGLLEQLVQISPVKPSFHPSDAELVRETLIKLEHGELNVTVEDRSDPRSAGLRALATKF